MHHSIEVINPVVEVVLWFRSISWLWGSSRKPIGAISFAGNMDEIEVKGLNSNNPTIDRCRRYNVGVVEHALNILHIDFDNEISETYKIELESSECAIQAIEFKL